MKNSLPLNLSHGPKTSSIFINRLHGLLHCIAISFLIYYRVSFFFQNPETRATPLFLWLLVFASELLLSFLWLLGQIYHWNPITRTVFPERLSEDDKLPMIDVFICTVDPDKEPTVEVMNTVLSAMALDYPADKVHVYLSDDGGATVTLHGMREAWAFARYWLPFCKKFGVKTRCPKAYFLASEDEDGAFGSAEFRGERQMIQARYEVFKRNIMRFGEDLGLRNTNNVTSGQGHPAYVEVIGENSNEVVPKDQADEMPLLVYVSREKRPSHPHHFKAGALNALLRVSGIISNSPYILVLDCDMYCNDPTSARQAMCFHLDSSISSSLAFVQFPQRFHNLSKHDIYDSQLRSVFEVSFYGIDGIMGPVLSGSGFYIKRESLYCNFIETGYDLMKLKSVFGSSNEFIKSLRHIYKDNTRDWNLSNPLLQEAKNVASCTYESDTRWGQEVGYLYLSVVEDVFTGYILHCKGWISVYLNPVRPQFLGAGITSLNDLLGQSTRWSSGLVEVGISRFCPLVYAIRRMSFRGTMSYAEMFLYPLCYCLTLGCFATVPQLCLLIGISLYPEVASPFFLIFSYIFLSALFKHLYEVIKTGGSIHTLIYEQRLWMMKAVSSHTYGSIDAILKTLGIREANFFPTNKVDDEEKLKLYQAGELNFQASPMILVPIGTIIILNMTSMAVGIIRAIYAGNLDKMFVQVFLTVYILGMNYTIIEGMILRKDKGRFPTSVTLISTISSILVMIFLSLGSIMI